MVKLIASFAVLLTFISCGGSQKATASEVGFVQLNNYFFQKKELLREENNYFLITNKPMFSGYFGMAATMNSKIVEPDFNGQVVVAVVSNITDEKKEIIIDRVSIGGKAMNVYFHVINGGFADLYKYSIGNGHSSKKPIGEKGKFLQR